MATICNQCGAEVANDSNCLACSAPAPEANHETTTLIVAAATAQPEPIISAIEPPAFATETDLKGIGGWLIPTMIGLGLGPLFALHGIYTSLHVLYGSGFQSSLAARPGLALLILFEATTNGILLIALVGLNVLFYRTRRSFPGWMITYLIAALLSTLTDHLFALHFHPVAQWGAVFQRLFAALIWVPYFLQSRRVKQTFVD